MTHTLPWQKPDPVKNYYPVPKVICQLGLSPGEIAVYSFLLFCEDRKTYQCYPSYRTIGDAVGMSRNTVCKYVRSLEEKGLIRTERTTVTLKDGRKRNGSLLYTILPVEQVKGTTLYCCRSGHTCPQCGQFRGFSCDAFQRLF